MKTLALISNQIFLPLNLWLWPAVVSKYTFVNKAWLHLLYVLLLGSFRQQQDLNSLILMLNRPLSVSLSSDVTFSNPSSLLATLHWTCSRMSASPFLIGSPNAHTVVQMWFHQCPKWGEGSFPWTYLLHSCYHHPGHLQEGAAKYWLTHGPPDPSGPSLLSCSLQLSPSLYWCIRCIPARTEEILSAFTEFHEIPDNPVFQLTGSSVHLPCPALKCTGSCSQHATSWDLLCLNSVPSSTPSTKKLSSIGDSINHWRLADNSVLRITILAANGPSHPSLSERFGCTGTMAGHAKGIATVQYKISTLSLSTEPAVTQGKQADFEMLWARAVHLVTNSILNTEGPIKQKVHAK